jgi:hypothetical protein
MFLNRALPDARNGALWPEHPSAHFKGGARQLSTARE